MWMSGAYLSYKTQHSYNTSLFQLYMFSDLFSVPGRLQIYITSNLARQTQIKFCKVICVCVCLV